MSASVKAAQRSIVWFRNDLRIHDNPVLRAASHSVIGSNAGTDLVCVYCFDPRHFCTTSFGSAKTGLYRAKFLIDSVSNLKKNLRSVGSDLLVTLAKPEDVLSHLCTQEKAATSVFVQGEATSEEVSVELAVQRSLKSAQHKLHRVVGGCSLYHPEDIPFSADLKDMPDTFTPFKEKVERRSAVRPESPTIRNGDLPNTLPPDSLPEGLSYEYFPTLHELGFTAEQVRSVTEGRNSIGVMDFEGGEDAALRRLETWMFTNDNLKDYFDIRNGMLGESYSSKLSPWLAAGCISPRRIFNEVKRYEQTRRIANKSTYWLIFELIWRDFYRYYCTKYGTRVFHPEGVIPRPGQTWRRDDEQERRWKEGRTGQPLVDANMRELLATGWMSNRGRQNVASYLTLDLGLDWRVGADHFESLLLDHDPCSNYGNWNAAAGLTGGRVNKFNIVKQSKDYDVDGDYIRHWLPELKDVPAPLVFEPWKMSVADQRKYNLRIGNEEGAYPRPIPLPSTTGGGDSSSSGGGYSSGTKRPNSSGGSEPRSSNTGYKSGGGSRGGGSSGGKWGATSKSGRVQHY